MSFFRKKPVVIEAVEWTGDLTAIEGLMSRSSVESVSLDFLSCDLLIPTLEGEMRTRPGDWIILGVKGELYPCKPDIFEETYEPVSPERVGKEGETP